MATQARPGISEFSVGPSGTGTKKRHRHSSSDSRKPPCPDPASGTGYDGVEQGAVIGKKAQIKTRGPWNKIRALRHERRVQKQKTMLELQS